MNKFKTKIACYLSSSSKLVSDIRSNIPSGYDACEFFHNDKSLNWYEFIDVICNNYHPFNAKIVTAYSVIKFDSFDLEWVFGEESFVTESGEKALKTINELTKQARELINFSNF